MRAWMIRALAGLLLAYPASASTQASLGTPFQLAQRLEEVAPAVCALAGRCTESLPSITVSSTDQAEKILRLELQDAATRAGVPKAEARTWAREEAERTVSIAAALYSQHSDTIFVLRDNVDRALERSGVLPSEADQLVTCLMAHEYTHTIQSAHLELPATLDELVLQRALQEGHAELVASEVCAALHGEPTRSLWFAFMGTRHLESQNPEDARVLAYGYARLWLQDRSDGSPQAAWPLLEQLREAQGRYKCLST